MKAFCGNHLTPRNYSLRDCLIICKLWSEKWKWKPFSHVRLFGVLQARILKWVAILFSRGCFLLQGIFPTQGWNPSLPHCRHILYQLSHQGSPQIVCSVQFSCSVMSNSLRPHEPQHARPPCPSPTPGVYPDSCPLSRWCHPTISFSVVPFSSCPQSAAAAAAKSLQSCPTLCDPMDCSLPGFSVHGILQARTLEWVAISFSNAWK